MVLSRSTWQNNVSLRGPKTVRVESLGADVILRPMTAARQSAIDEAHPVDDRGIIRDAKSYVLAIIADTVVGDDGQPIFTVEDLRDKLEWRQTRELHAIVSAFLENRAEDAGKN